MKPVKQPVVRTREKQKVAPETWVKEEPKYRFAMMCAVSGILLAASLYVILVGGYPDAVEKWAYGIVGTICGFWLRKP